MPEEFIEEQEDLEQDREYTPTEEKAMAKGWKPEDKWEGEPDAWATAYQFLRHESLFSKIGSQKGTISKLEGRLSNLQKSISAITSMQTDQLKKQFEDQESRLREVKKQAIEDSDLAALDLANEAIRASEKAKDNLEVVKVPDDIGPTQEYTEDDFTSYYNESWKDKNTWYDDPKKSHYKAMADGLMSAYYKNDPSSSPEEVFAYVTKEMKTVMGDPKSGTTGRGVESRAGSSRVKRGKVAGISGLAPELQAVAKNIIDAIGGDRKKAEERWLEAYNKNLGGRK